MSSRYRSTATKYRHVVGSVVKKEVWYPDLKPVDSAGDNNTVAGSSQWIAVAWSSAGSVALLDVATQGKRPTTDLPMVQGHSTPITDLSFSPFDDNLLATAAEDATVKLWKIPPGNKENLSAATTVLMGHSKKVESLKFHPTAANVLATGGADKVVKIWDLEAGKAQLSLDSIHGDVVHCIAWNGNGSLLATVCKDKKIRVLDPRSNSVVSTGEGHQGLKASRVVWLRGDQIATTGFSKMRERQFGVWDSKDLSKSLQMKTMDSSTGVLDILFDTDTNLLFLAGKGDGGIKVFEVGDKPLTQDLPGVQSADTQKSVAIMPKRACELMDAEVVRLLKLTNNAVAPISFCVPRKSKSEFQEDLFPPTASTQSALSSSEWFGGANKDPVLVQLKPETNKHKFWLDENEVAPVQSSPSSSSVASSASSSSVASSSFSSVSKIEPEVEQVVEELKTVKVVRSSKFRHISGQGTKQENCFTNLRIDPSNNNSVIKANQTFFCVQWQGAGGRVAVIPLTQTGKQRDEEKMQCIECGSDCLDFEFSPFDDSILATVTESAHLQIWKVPSDGITQNMRTPDSTMKGHQRRVTTVDFHPTASNVAVTTSGDLTVKLWDIQKKAEQLSVTGHGEAIQSISWNYSGSTMVTSCKDSLMRLVDPRAKKIVDSTVAHEGVKGFKATWMGNSDRILSVGFSKLSERVIKTWDIRKLATPYGQVSIDNGAGVITPYYDADLGVCFMASKGDANIKMFEINDEAPYIHYLTQYSSPIPAQGIALLPKTSCNVRIAEIARFLKLGSDFVEPLSFTVPRTRMEFFQDDLFPPTRNTGKAALSADAWFSGQNQNPELVSLLPSGMTTLSDAPQEKKVKKYDFKQEVAKQDSGFSKEKFLSNYHQLMTGAHGEGDSQILEQDKMEGADPDEWD